MLISETTCTDAENKLKRMFAFDASFSDCYIRI